MFTKPAVLHTKSLASWGQGPGEEQFLEPRQMHIERNWEPWTKFLEAILEGRKQQNKNLISLSSLLFISEAFTHVELKEDRGQGEPSRTQTEAKGI